jgi:hypothetical protein
LLTDSLLGAKMRLAVSTGFGVNQAFAIKPQFHPLPTGAGKAIIIG